MFFPLNFPPQIFWFLNFSAIFRFFHFFPLLFFKFFYQFFEFIVIVLPFFLVLNFRAIFLNFSAVLFSHQFFDVWIFPPFLLFLKFPAVFLTPTNFLCLFLPSIFEFLKKIRKSKNWRKKMQNVNKFQHEWSFAIPTKFFVQ